jgi:hypothetical protein
MKGQASVLLLGFLLASCSWLGGESMRTMEKNRETWENLDIANYQYTFDVQAFTAGGPKPAQIVVRADTLHAVLDPKTRDTLRARGSNRLVWKEWPQQYPTIDRLFEIIGEQLTKIYGRPDSIHVEYNEERGYPEHIYIDPQKGTFDDESTATVKGLVVNRHDQK